MERVEKFLKEAETYYLAIGNFETSSQLPILSQGERESAT